MRNLPPRILVLSAFFGALASATAIVPLATPASAQTLPGPEVHPLKQLWRDANGITEDAGLIRLRATYCKPPLQPTKAEPQAAIDALRQKLQALKSEHNQLKTKFDDALGLGELGEATRAGYPRLDGMEADHAYYWSNSNKLLTAAQEAIDAKQKALNRAPERDCGQKTPKTEGIIGGQQPPVNLTDPGVALPAVQVRDVEIPPVPARFCSEAEKQATLKQFWDVSWSFYMNYQGAREYEAAIGNAMRENRGNGPALAALRPAASAATKQHAKRHDDFQNAYGRAKTMPIQNCGGEAPKEVGSLPGWSLGTGLAAGELTIPKKPYLSTEIAGDLKLGVVALDRTDTVASLGLSGAYAFGGSGPKIGNPRHMHYIVSAELGRLNYGIHANAPDIVTTTEGVGIPGTGDLTSMFPAGVFFANPAFNDVEGLNYRHHGEWQGIRLGFDQRSEYDCGAVTLGAGLSFGDFDTSDVLTGSIPGFLTDFRYATDVDTRKVGLSVRGGVEIPVDVLWGGAIRYAGEFSGVRVRSNVELGFIFLNAEGVDRLDLTGFVSDAQAVRVDKDDTTFGYKLGAAIAYAPPGTKGLDLALGVEYGESDTHPVAHRSGQTGETTRLEFEEQDIFVGTLRSTFKF